MGSERHLGSTVVTLSIIEPLRLSAGPGSDQVTGQEVSLLKDQCSQGIYKFTVLGQCRLPSPGECKLPPLSLMKVSNKEQITKMG